MMIHQQQTRPPLLQRQPILIAVAALLIGWPLNTGRAIQPSQWEHTTEADFVQGTQEDTVVTNLGDIKLAMRTQVIGEIPQQASVIYDLQATLDGDVYLSVGPNGALLRRRGDKIEQVMALPRQQVFSLDLTAEGDLLVAISAETSRVAILKDDQLHTLVELEGVRYIWDMYVTGQRLYVATGTDGKLLSIDLTPLAQGGDPTVVELLDAAQSNLLCLAGDHLGRLCVGTDTDGLVYRVMLQDDGHSEAFVLYDAPEPEIGSLLIMPDNTLYAGTADAQQARPGRLEEAATESGRPETMPLSPEGDDLPPQIPPKPQPKNEPNHYGEPAASPETPPVSSSTTESTASQSSKTNNAKNNEPTGTHAGATPEPNSDPMRQRLRMADPPGVVNGQPMSVRSKDKHSTGSTRKRAALTGSHPQQNPKEGNAIYRITPDGFVTEVFRESVTILKLLADPGGEGRLLVATGDEGQIYQVNPKSEETIILVDLQPDQVPAMLDIGDHRVLLGTANPATLVQLDAGFTREGIYTSSVLDASQISLWGKLHWAGSTPPGTSVAMQTRSGNVGDPEQAAWSDWSPPVSVNRNTSDRPGHELTPNELAITCPPARFLQYRLTLTGDQSATPVVDWVRLHYVVPNLKPVVSSITAAYPGDDNGYAGGRSGSTSQRGGFEVDEPSSQLEVQWEASDPNADRLLYTLEYRPLSLNKWLMLVDDLDQNQFTWETKKTPDGRYYVRVTATDRLDNDADLVAASVRVSDPVLVDNTPPEFDSLEHRVEPTGLKVTGSVRDRLSTIRAISYAVDSHTQWHPVLPDDLIYDSTQETFSIMISDLEPAPHVVTLRVHDDQGNAYYESLLVLIE